MLSVHRVVVMAVLMGLTGVTGVGAQVQSRPRILRVERLVAADRSASPVPPYLPKFMDDLAPAAREVFNVYWTAPQPGLPAGTLLTFEYRQKRAERIKFLHVKYPFTVAGERKATFEIAGPAARAGGPVTAWRVRVVSGGRALAESVSESWRSLDAPARTAR